MRMNLATIDLPESVISSVNGSRVIRALNDRLPDDLVVWAAKKVPSTTPTRPVISRKYYYRCEVIKTWPEDPALTSSTAVPYLRLLALVCSGWLMFRAYNLATRSQDKMFRNSKHITARFFIDHHVVESRSLTKIVTEGATVVQDAQFYC